MRIQTDVNYFEKVYEETYKNTLKFVMCKCNNLDDVNDIVQDVYVELYKVWKNLKTVQINNIYGYIIGIAGNIMKKYYKNKQLINLNTTDIEEAEIKDDIDIEEIVLNKDDFEKIWNYIKHKKPIIWKIFYLHYYFDNTIREVAEELDINESAVKNYLYRTLNELRITFGKESD